MSLAVAAFFVALLCLFTVALAFNVSVGRFRHRIPYGEGNERELSRPIRAHMNSLEHLVPIGLLLLSYALVGGDVRAVGALGSAALLARAFLTFGILRKGAFWARRIGAYATYLLEVALVAIVLLRSGLLG